MEIENGWGMNCVEMEIQGEIGDTLPISTAVFIDPTYPTPKL
jgi:hypothetical protein